MSAMAAKQKISDERRTLKERFFFIKRSGKLLCLICNETITVKKEYNARRHYENEYKAKFENLTGELRKILSNLKIYVTSRLYYQVI